jgi:hypothetical protein
MGTDIFIADRSYHQSSYIVDNSTENRRNAPLFIQAKLLRADTPIEKREETNHLITGGYLNFVC